MFVYVDFVEISIFQAKWDINGIPNYERVNEWGCRSSVGFINTRTSGDGCRVTYFTEY